jgi:hypothetical protein
MSIVIEDLAVTENATGITISYTPVNAEENGQYAFVRNDVAYDIYENPFLRVYEDNVPKPVQWMVIGFLLSFEGGARKVNVIPRARKRDLFANYIARCGMTS